MTQPILVKTYSIFDDLPIIHGYSTRQGGKSESKFSALNLGLNTADSAEHVRENRRLFFNYLNIDPQKLVFPEQVHSSNVSIVRKPGKVAATDALITDRPGLILTIQTADCFPVFIYDYNRHICAIIHSGWRGTAAGITIKTVELLSEKFNCCSENMVVAIGAGIQQKNYQVDTKTARYFHNTILKADGDLHFKLDVQGAIIKQLNECGIKNSNIEADDICTYAAADLYYSYRRDGKKSGRMMAVFGLK